MSAAPKLIVTMTTEELSDLMQQSAKRAVAELVSAQQDEVLDLEGCAKLLKRHEDVVMRRLVKLKGLPVHYISDREPRFVRREVMAWLASLPSQLQKSESK